MSPEQSELVEKAKESLRAARLLHEQGFHGFSASRSYYAMFYLAEALLLGEGLSFSKHSAVHAAFGERFVKTGRVAPEFHRSLIRAMEVRQVGDYDSIELDGEESAEQVAKAEDFLAMAEPLMRASPPSSD